MVGDAGDRARILSGRKQLATGSHLPPEDTALPPSRSIRVVVFRDPIPQSHRRASGDLLCTSLTSLADDVLDPVDFHTVITRQ
jgi:hypothetical protein